MTTITKRVHTAQGDWLRMVFTLVRREVRDSLRDWRIIVPITILTIFFPVLMTFVADKAMNWVTKYGPTIIGNRLIPFLLLVVGFFPISFSLVIALETFVGEKERRSLEPILATPITDAQLYLGKTLAAMIPPLLAAYLGITVYLTGLYFFKGWAPSLTLLALVIALTTGEALVMVSGAVVLSSQTTSVRAANLLASFIIIPMALLMQGEAIIMFWANYSVLWWIVLFLALVDIILVRMGVHIFNREELLGHEIDELNLASLWRTFKEHFCWERWFFGLDVPEMPPGLRWLGALGGLYRYEIPAILRRSWPAILAVVIGLVAAAYVGDSYAALYPIPPSLLHLEQISVEKLTNFSTVGWLPNLTLGGVLSNNVRSLLLGGLLAVFSFGSLAVVLLMAPMIIVFFFAAQVAQVGYSPLLFLSTFVLPHGIFEMSAAIVATALAVRLGATFMSPPRGMTVSEGWLCALADFIKVFVAFVMPLLALAATVEVYVTPYIVVWAFGG